MEPPLFEGHVNKDAITLCYGSSLYFLGGVTTPKNYNKMYLQPSDSVSTFDLIKPDAGFKELEPMQTERSTGQKHATVTLENGRIYVFGGVHERAFSKHPCWSEFYDPEKGCWKALHKSRYASDDASKLANMVDRDDYNFYAMAFGESLDKVIMVRGSEEDDVLVHPVSAIGGWAKGSAIWDKTCNMPIPHMGFRGMFETPVKVGETIYWLNNDTKSDILLEAYNLSSCVTNSGPISRLDRWYQKQWLTGRFLMHLGGDDDKNLLCFLWTEYFGEDTAIHCVRFRVSDVSAYGLLNVRSSDTLSYTISKQHFELNKAFPYVSSGIIFR